MRSSHTACRTPRRRAELEAEVVALRQLAGSAPTALARLIHAELLKLGIEVLQATVAKYERRPLELEGPDLGGEGGPASARPGRPAPGEGERPAVPGAQRVAIRRATIYGGDVTVLSQSYDTTTVIGAGNRMTFSFTIKADVPPGIYYPYFSLDFRDAGYLRYPIPIRVDNQPLTLAVLNKPDVFSEGRKDRVDILVGNPRDNPVSGVVVNFLGSRMDPVPSSYFIGNLDPDQSRQVSVNITPEEPGNLQVLVDYKNGINDHTDSLTLPVRFGESKTEANPV